MWENFLIFLWENYTLLFSKRYTLQTFEIVKVLWIIPYLFLSSMQKLVNLFNKYVLNIQYSYKWAQESLSWNNFDLKKGGSWLERTEVASWMQRQTLKGEGISRWKNHISKGTKRRIRGLILIHGNYHIGENSAHLKKGGATLARSRLNNLDLGHCKDY